MFAGTQRDVFAAVQEIQTQESYGLAISCRRLHPAWHRFCKAKLEGEFARRVRKGKFAKDKNTEFDGSFIDQIALLEAAPSALALPSCSSASRFSKGLTQ